MKSKGLDSVEACGVRAGAELGFGLLPLELRIGSEIVSIWLDDKGIHFRHPIGGHTEGVLPWDVAMAMSLVPEHARRHDARPSFPGG